MGFCMRRGGGFIRVFVVSLVRLGVLVCFLGLRSAGC